MPRPIHFEIPAEDPERSIGFYSIAIHVHHHTGGFGFSEAGLFGSDGVDAHWQVREIVNVDRSLGARDSGRR